MTARLWTAPALAAVLGCLAVAGEAAQPLFLPYQLHSLETSSPALAVGDVTGDRLADVVLTTDFCTQPGDCRLVLFPQTHLQVLTGPIEYPSGEGKSLALGDFDGDGRQDVALATGDNLDIFFQDPSGVLRAPRHDPPLRATWLIAAGDLDGDGRTDLVSLPFAASGRKVLDLYYQNSVGGLNHRTTPAPIGLRSGQILIVDLDLDGLSDILLVGLQERGLTIFYQGPDGTFARPVLVDLGIADTYMAAAVGNFDADPAPEIVLANGGSDGQAPYLRILDQASPRQWRSLVKLATNGPVSALQAADLDRDGRTDLVALSRAGLVQVFVQRITAELDLEGEYDLPFANYWDPLAVAVGDLDSDGLPDLAVANDNYGLLTLLQRGSAPPPPPGPEARVRGDPRLLLQGEDLW